MLTTLQKKYGPFAVPVLPAWGLKQTHLTTCDAASRLRAVRESTDADWLNAVIRDRDVQATVRLAAERRLRWVKKAIKNLTAAAQSQA